MIKINLNSEDFLNAEEDFNFFDRMLVEFRILYEKIISDDLYVKLIVLIEHTKISFVAFSFDFNEGHEYLSICLQYFCFLFQIDEAQNEKYVEEIFNLLIKKRVKLISAKLQSYEHLKTLFNDKIQFSNEIFPSEIEKTIIQDEIEQFIKSSHSRFFKSDILQMSKYSLSTFFIRRFYFESNSFEDSNFFNYDEMPIRIQSFQDKEFINIRDITTNITLAFHKRTCKLVVIKFVEKNDEFFKEDEILYNKINEINNSVKYLGYIKNKENKIVKLIIDFMSEGTLQDYISKGKLIDTKFDKYVISFKILKILYQLHSNEIIHRDLKPNNIFINHDFDFFIGDFDSSRVSFKKTQSETFTKDIGSIKYSSPEMINSQSYTNKTDIYSFGLVLYYIFTGKHPYQNEDDYDIIKFKNDPKFDQFKENISDILIQNIYSKCVKFNPDERPNAIDLIDDFISLSFDEYQNRQPNLFYYFMIDENEKFIKQKITNFYNKIFDTRFSTSDIYEIMNVFVNKYNDLDMIRYIKSLALKNNPLGLVLYGDIEYIMRKSTNCFIYYGKAAKEYNNAQAMYNLGLIYQEGIIVAKDLNKAIYYYTKSADLNYDLAQQGLGLIYLDTQDGFLSVNKAIHYLTLASNQSKEIASYILGLLYFGGKLVEPDIDKAIHYFKLASDLNFADADLLLGIIYMYESWDYYDINKGIYYLTKSSNAGVQASNYFLARAYYFGLSVPPDIDKAIDLLLCSYEKNPAAQYFLGTIYLNDIKDVEKSIYYLTMASNNNILEAHSLLGVIYYDETLHHFDINKSIYYYSLAAVRNDSDSLLMLGRIYLENKYIPRNIDKAIKYLIQAANLNNKMAQSHLGILYFYGKYIQKNINKSLYYFEKAASQNEIISQLHLGYIYLYGIGVPYDLNKSIYYFHLCEDNSTAQLFLGFIYMKTDINKAIKYLMLSANQNNSHAAFQLGVYYLKKIKDHNLALKYFYLSSSLHNSDANYFLGLFYYIGYIVQQNANKAVCYLREAANQKNKYAQYLIGLIYIEGKYIHQDIEKGVYYLNLSSDQMYIDSQIYLGELFFNDTIIPHDYIKSICYFKKASSFNNSIAKNYLGIIYKNGLGVSKNIFNSIEYFNEAIKQKNDEIACFNLARIYYFGIDIDKNVPKAIDLLERSSNKSLDHAFIFLFFIYSIGDDKYKNIHKMKLCELKINEFFKSKYQFSFLLGDLLNIFHKKRTNKENKKMIFQFFKDNDLYHKNEEIYFFIFFYFMINRNLPKNSKEVIQKIKQKDITKQFYDGFYSD